MLESSAPALNGKRLWSLIALGLVAGFLSGMFGVGGGIVIVPGLMMVAGFTQRQASGTSLATIIPLAAVGVTSYAIQGSVSLVGALLLAVGAMVGTQLGTWMLARIKLKVLQLLFAGFVFVVAVNLFIVVPSRDAVLTIDVLTGTLLILLGFITGVLAGLLGIGGGVIVVPALMLLFGASDLVAKGTSLLMMIPAALAGTLSNARRGTVDIKTAVVVGIPACTTTLIGSQFAGKMAPEIANVLFAIFLTAIGIRPLLKH